MLHSDSDAVDAGSPMDFAAEFVGRLSRTAEELDAEFADPVALSRLLGRVAQLGSADSDEAVFAQQYLLSRIYALNTQLPFGPTAEGSIVLHAVTRQLERDTVASEDAWIDQGIYDQIPDDPDQF